MCVCVCVRLKLNFNAFFTKRSVPIGQFFACFVGVDASSMGEAVSGAGNCNSAKTNIEIMLKLSKCVCVGEREFWVFCLWGKRINVCSNTLTGSRTMWTLIWLGASVLICMEF